MGQISGREQVPVDHPYSRTDIQLQASKLDFNFGGQLAINSKNLVAKLKLKWPK